MSKKTDRNDEVSAGLNLTRLERLSRLMRSASHTHALNPAQWEALRYLFRANGFSNSPGALARYLGATKGTTSQTVLALIKKGLVAKQMRGADARSVVLTLTQAGLDVLQHDPLRDLEKSIRELKDKTAKRFAKGLSEILDAEIRRQGEPDFGTCESCAHAVEKNGHGFCGAMQLTIDKIEALKLCVHHKTIA